MQHRSRTSTKRGLARVACFAAALLNTCALGALDFEIKEAKSQPSPLDREVVARFPFKNSGSSAVKITDMQSCCNCTKPSVSRTSYKPGESGEIVITFEIGDRHGPQRKGVVVTTSDPTQPPIVLFIAAEIPTVMTHSHQVLLWKEGEPASGKKVIVTTSASAGVRDLRVRSGSKAIGASVKPAGENRFEVTVTPSASAVNISDALHLEALMANGQFKRSSVYVRVR